MPVDPNEPTYCLCHQVSYGEMIGCDNPDVSAHFYTSFVFRFEKYVMYKGFHFYFVILFFSSAQWNGFTFLVWSLQQSQKGNGSVQNVLPTERKSSLGLPTLIPVTFYLF